MASDLLTALRINEKLPENKFLIVTKDDVCDTGFVHVDVISHLLKKDFSAVIINCAQSYNHYYHSFSRSGLILKSLVANKRVVMIDVLQMVQETDESDDHLFYDMSKGLSKLSTLLMKAVESLCETSQCKGVVVFIDELNVLKNIGFTINQVSRFIHECRTLCSLKQTSPGCLILGAQLEPHDSELSLYFNFLCSVADIRINVYGLSTGFSKDVHGKIFLEVKDECHTSSEVLRTELFKVGDKGVKFSSSGI